MATEQPNTIYQLRIELGYIRPPIWRRVQVPADMTLEDLHKIIQVAMDWYDMHMHHFIVGKKFYVPQEAADSMMKMEEDESYEGIKISDVLTQEKQKIQYEYDFGDSWIHIITLQKILERDKNKFYPVCTGGRRNAPPEDIGGIPGYFHLLEVLDDPSHKEYNEYTEWLGEDYDPEWFEKDYVNAGLEALFKGNRKQS